jgi:hypothetical protein
VNRGVAEIQEERLAIDIPSRDWWLTDDTAGRGGLRRSFDDLILISRVLSVKDWSTLSASRSRV